MLNEYTENDMTAISLCLPDDLEANLKAEAQLEGKSQSEIARLAITEYLARLEKERFTAEMVATGFAGKRTDCHRIGNPVDRSVDQSVSPCFCPIAHQGIGS